MRGQAAARVSGGDHAGRHPFALCDAEPADDRRPYTSKAQALLPRLSAAPPCVAAAAAGGGGGGWRRLAADLGLLALVLVLAALEALLSRRPLLAQLRVSWVAPQALLAELQRAGVLVQAITRPGGAEVCLDIAGLQLERLLAVLDHLAVVLLEQLYRGSGTSHLRFKKLHDQQGAICAKSARGLPIRVVY